ncbi:MAG: hypothetical protein OFPII_35930 [Osedax symbiont Rs1]|nr:MAG: hypothetical protein OFPII_35930 [Osedax symbiont Rs1]
MEGLDDSYYIMSRDGCKPEGVIYASGDDKTHELKYGSRYLEGGRAMFFHNANAEDWRRNGIKENIGDIIFHGSHFMIKKKVRDKLLKYHIHGLQYYPAVYTDIEGNIHYDYFFVNIYAKKDWCYIERSQLDKRGQKRLDRGDKPGVETIALDFHKMLCVPEEERLMFRMSNIDMGKPFIHKKVKDIFEEFNLVDTRFFRVDQWARNAHLRPE